MSEYNQKNQQRKPNWVTYIVVIIFIAIVIVVGENVGWNCIERNNCNGCWELHWDTEWCNDCLEKCRVLPQHKKKIANQFGLLLIILSFPIIIFQVIKDKSEKFNGQLWLGFILLVFGVV